MSAGGSRRGSLVLSERRSPGTGRYYKRSNAHLCKELYSLPDHFTTLVVSYSYGVRGVVSHTSRMVVRPRPRVGWGQQGMEGHTISQPVRLQEKKTGVQKQATG